MPDNMLRIIMFTWHSKRQNYGKASFHSKSPLETEAYTGGCQDCLRPGQGEKENDAQKPHWKTDPLWNTRMSRVGGGQMSSKISKRLKIFRRQPQSELLLELLGLLWNWPHSSGTLCFLLGFLGVQAHSANLHKCDVKLWTSVIIRICKQYGWHFSQA